MLWDFFSCTTLPQKKNTAVFRGEAPAGDTRTKPSMTGDGLYIPPISCFIGDDLWRWIHKIFQKIGDLQEYNLGQRSKIMSEFYLFGGR